MESNPKVLTLTTRMLSASDLFVVSLRVDDKLTGDLIIRCFDNSMLWVLERNTEQGRDIAVQDWRPLMDATLAPLVGPLTAVLWASELELLLPKLIAFSAKSARAGASEKEAQDELSSPQLTLRSAA